MLAAKDSLAKEAKEEEQDKEAEAPPTKQFKSDSSHSMPPPSSAASSTDPPSDGAPATWQEFMTKYRHKKGDPPNTGLTMAAMGAKWQILKNQRFQRKSEQLLAEKMNQVPVSRKAMDLSLIHI